MMTTKDEGLAVRVHAGGVGRLARPPFLVAYNLWAWPFLAVNTLMTFAGIRVRGLLSGDTEAAGDSMVPRWARRNLSAGLFRVEVTGEPPPPGSVLVANHGHFFDIELLFAVVPPPVRFVARTGVLRVPIVGTILRAGGHVLVERESKGGNEDALERAADLACAGVRVVFFPEGTRSRDGSIGPFRSGALRAAARAEVPIVPVVLSGTRETMPRFPGPMIPCRLAVRYLPPRRVGESEAGDPAWRQALRDEMAEALDGLAARSGPRL